MNTPSGKIVPGTIVYRWETTSFAHLTVKEWTEMVSTTSRYDPPKVTLGAAGGGVRPHLEKYQSEISRKEQSTGNRKAGTLRSGWGLGCCVGMGSSSLQSRLMDIMSADILAAIIARTIQACSDDRFRVVGIC